MIFHKNTVGDKIVAILLFLLSQLVLFVNIQMPLVDFGQYSPFLYLAIGAVINAISFVFITKNEIVFIRSVIKNFNTARFLVLLQMMFFLFYSVELLVFFYFANLSLINLIYVWVGMLLYFMIVFKKRGGGI
jgi:hypothetical protein